VLPCSWFTVFENKWPTGDNGTEFKNSQIEGFLEEVGIKHEFPSPYTPQPNGVVERKNITLLDMVRTMLDEYKTPGSILGGSD
jgi:transposase InsO family protein